MPRTSADVPSRSSLNFDVADDASAMPLNRPLTATSVTFTGLIRRWPLQAPPSVRCGRGSDTPSASGGGLLSLGLAWITAVRVLPNPAMHETDRVCRGSRGSHG